jgi:acyl-CoA thioester hydrolase
VKRMRQRIGRGWDTLELAVPVQFSDLDPMRRVWHGHYLRYCEAAREAYCASRGLSYQRMEELGCQAPIVRLQIEYLAPARLGEVLRVRIAHLPGSEPGLQLRYEIHGPAAGGGRLLLVAESMQVFIDAAGEAPLEPPPAAAAFLAAIAARERAGGVPPAPAADRP